MNNKYKSLVKDTVIFGIGSLGSKVILFFLVPLYTNFLTTEEYGIAELVSTFTQLIVPFSAVVINQALIRFGMKKTEKPEDVVKASFVVLLFSVAITILLAPLVGIYSPLSNWKWYLAMQVIFSNFSEVERSYLKVKGRNRTFAIISIIQTSILAASNIILLVVFHTGVQGYLLANIISLAPTTIILFFAAGLQNDLRIGRYNPELLKRMLRYSFPLIFSNVSWWVIHSSDKIMIEWMIGASALGIYTAATKIPSLINVIIGIFNQAWGLSSIREIESTDDTSFYVSVFNLFCTILFGASIVFTSLIKPFMGIYVGEAFRDAWQYTPLLLSAAVFFSVSAFIGTLYAALQKTSNDMWTSMLCALINVVVNYIGIQMVGTWGAIIGTVTAYFVISTIRLFDIRRHMKFDVDLLRYGINTALMLGHALLVSLKWHILICSIITIAVFIMLNRSTISLMIRKAITRQWKE
jgi:O-antigen/teichoic acid export membrane protein